MIEVKEEGLKAPEILAATEGQENEFRIGFCRGCSLVERSEPGTRYQNGWL
jgi:hypothetical protein